MTMEEIERLKELSRKIWGSLTDDERQKIYCGDGTIEFVEYVSNILCIDLQVLNQNNYEKLVDDVINYMEEV